jgi:DNA-binding transcriptional ArsR family regulator
MLAGETMATRPLSPMRPPRPGETGTMAKLFRGLGDPTRLRILLLLQQREWSVNELVEELSVQQGRMSSHLACLRWCGLVRTRRDKRRLLYSVADDRVSEIVHLAESFLEDNAEQIDLCKTIDASS